MTAVLQALGGIGLFLLGMSIMTQGLRALAGRALRRALERFTHSPASGATTGAIATAIVQSSSAIVVTAVGFVGAGLMTFPQALGVIFGANIGTTLTGWLVALVGFKLSLGTTVTPLVFLGALLHLFGRGRAAHAGFAVAGFGLIFVGITWLQVAMASAEGIVTPETFPGDGFVGRLLLVAIGIAMTLVTQSSSAGVATALAAVATGTIDFTQAAAIVIGMDIGTTSTAALATIGGSTAVRRTGFAHVTYNVMTGCVAFAILPLYSLAVDELIPGAIERSPELALVGFHTFFNGLGVVLILPFTHRFADFIERLFPGVDTATDRLEPSLLRDPSAAYHAASSALRMVMQRVLHALTAYMHGLGSRHIEEVLPAVDEIATVRQYIGRIQHVDWPLSTQMHRAALHLLDHCERLLHHAEHHQDAWAFDESASLREASTKLARTLEKAAAWHERAEDSELASDIASSCSEIANHFEPYRRGLIERAAAEGLSADDVIARIEAARWFSHIAEHLAREVHYLHELTSAARPGKGAGAMAESTPPQMPSDVSP